MQSDYTIRVIVKIKIMNQNGFEVNVLEKKKTKKKIIFIGFHSDKHEK